MSSRKQQLEYAIYLKRLYELFVIKENIAFEYQNAHYNRAAAQIDKEVDRCLDNNLNAVIDGTYDMQGPNLDHVINEALSRQQKMLVRTDDKFVQHAVEKNSKDFTNFIQNRIEKENHSLQAKIQKEYEKKKYKDMSEDEAKKIIRQKFQDSARKRSKNIVKDALHTNQSHISWIYNTNKGMKYKVWMNGQGKSKVRSWHIKSKIFPVEIDDYFDIYGPRGHARMMYPGDLDGGAENVANCRCWLHYTNTVPRNLKKKGTLQINPNVTFENENKETFNANAMSDGESDKNNTTSTSTNTNKGIFTNIRNKISETKEKINNKITRSLDSHLKRKAKDYFIDFKNLTPKNRKDKISAINNEKFIKNIKIHSETRSLNELLEEYPDLSQILSLADYHSKNADNKNEYFSALSRDGRLLSLLYKGKEGETRFPKTFREESVDNILFTLHNHKYGAIIPSGDDIHNVIAPNIQLTGIVSEGNFALIINNNEKISDKEKARIENDFDFFDMWVTNCFDVECEKNINNLKKLYSGEEYKKKEQQLFNKYVSKNNKRFGDEFNHRMKKYNIELIRIKL